MHRINVSVARLLLVTWEVYIQYNFYACCLTKQKEVINQRTQERKSEKEKDTPIWKDKIGNVLSTLELVIKIKKSYIIYLVFIHVDKL